MKIAIITNLYPPYVRGGAENVVVRTVEALQELYPEHEVFVISSHPRNKGEEALQDTGTTEKVYRLYPRNIYYLLDDNKYVWPIRLIWHVIDAFCWVCPKKIAEILKQEKPDIVITHNLKGIGLKIPREIQKLGLPHVHVMHDLQLLFPSGLKFFSSKNGRWYARFAYSVYRIICKRRLGKPNLVIFPSAYLRDAYLEKGFCKNAPAVVMPNPAPQIQPVVHEYRQPGPLRLLFVGQLEQHKGVRFLLDAVNRLPDDAQVIFAGEGTCAGRVAKAAARDKRISYLGYVSLDQIVSCLGIADALVVPSLCYENSPTVIYEALQAGVPVLASNIGGVGELVQDGKNGFLFIPGDMKDFLRAVDELDRRKDEFFESQDEIKQTVAPYALGTYTRALVEKLEDILMR
ncbi:MAG: glycosyltransferase [bacterium]